MPDTLPDYLKKRAVRSFHYLLREAESVSAEKALRFATPDWPPHKFGIGQNGSIAGIVFHVAAWKVLTLPLFEPDGAMIPLSSFDYKTAPKPNDWPGIVTWLREVGETWNTRLLALPDTAFDETRDWDGPTLTLDALDGGEDLLLRVGGGGRPRPVERELHVGRGEGRAVVEGHALAQPERVGEPVGRDLPGLGELGDDPALRVEPGPGPRTGWPR